MDNLMNWLSSSGLRIAIYIFVTILTLKFGTSAINKIIHRSVMADSQAHSQRATELRENTLVKILGSVFKTTVIFVNIVLIMSELGINLTPLFASVGFFSIAVGFGAQSLVKDIVAGIFILLENQYRVGDIVELAGASGKVERMTLRVTVVRSMNGNVHYIPNGVIKQATNKTMVFSKVNLDINVSYDTDIDRVEKIINGIGKELSKDKKWKTKIIEAPHFLHVSKLDNSSVVVKIIGKTEPNKRWSVTGELRRRILKTFKEEGIEIPFPQMVVHKTSKTK